MKSYQNFQDYLWLVKTIYQCGPISFGDLQQRFEAHFADSGRTLSRSTFKRHRRAIEELFDINIGCLHTDATFRYYIENPEVFRTDSLQNWMLTQIDTQAILLDNLTLRDRIVMQEYSTDNAYLNDIMQAMRQGVAIRIGYRRFGKSLQTNLVLQPYCLKQFAQRWYLLARTTAGELRVYALDRMEGLELTKNEFAMEPDFDAHRFFANYFGVIIGDGTPPQEIVLRVYGTERYYVRSLPLHVSQQEINRTEEYADFHYFLCPTLDFRQAILANPAVIEVLQPESLRREIAETLRKGNDLYK